MMTGLYEYFGLVLDAAITAYLIQLHRRDCRTINNLKNAPALDIGPDLAALVDAYPDQTLPYAVVRGKVAEINGTVESTSGAKGVMQIITVHEISTRKFGNSWDTESIPPLNETRNSVPFALQPISNSDNASSGSSMTSPLVIEVKNPFDSIWENLLLPCSSCFIPKNSSISSLVMGGLSNPKTVGIKRSELFLPIGTVVTGVGQITLDSKNGRFILQEPAEWNLGYPYILTTLPLEDLMCKLEMKKQMQRFIIGATMSVGLIILCKRVYSWWRRYKMEQLRESILKERRSKNLDTLCQCQTCLVCLTNPREVILLDCGHVAICADCVLKVNGSCPICRERISVTRKAYIA